MARSLRSLLTPSHPQKLFESLRIPRPTVAEVVWALGGHLPTPGNSTFPLISTKDSNGEAKTWCGRLFKSFFRYKHSRFTHFSFSVHLSLPSGTHGETIACDRSKNSDDVCLVLLTHLHVAMQFHALRHDAIKQESRLSILHLFSFLRSLPQLQNAFFSVLRRFL